MQSPQREHGRLQVQFTRASIAAARVESRKRQTRRSPSPSGYAGTASARARSSRRRLLIERNLAAAEASTNGSGALPLASAPCVDSACGSAGRDGDCGQTEDWEVVLSTMILEADRGGRLIRRAVTLVEVVGCGRLRGSSPPRPQMVRRSFGTPRRPFRKRLVANSLFWAPPFQGLCDFPQGYRVGRSPSRLGQRPHPAEAVSIRARFELRLQLRRLGATISGKPATRFCGFAQVLGSAIFHVVRQQPIKVGAAQDRVVFGRDVLLQVTLPGCLQALPTSRSKNEFMPAAGDPVCHLPGLLKSPQRRDAGAERNPGRLPESVRCVLAPFD